MLKAVVESLLLFQLSASIVHEISACGGGAGGGGGFLRGNSTKGCESPLGMENETIPDSAITATSVFNSSYGAYNARLCHIAGSGRTGAWSPSALDLGQWIQVDLGNITAVTKIATQGRQEAPQWVTEFKVSYSFDGGYFKFCQQAPNNTFDQMFQGNSDQNSTVFNTFEPPIVARFIRIHPITFHGWISLRMELYGCRSGFPSPEAPVCEAGLGLESFVIPNSSVTASSTLGLNKPGNGRLHLYVKPGSVGGWVSGNTGNDSWFQVDFGNWTTVTRISTQGRQDVPQWVTEYRVSYSYDEIFFTDYPKIFDGNSDQFTVVSHKLKDPITTRYIRINPLSYYGWIALRADFYGCQSENVPDMSCWKPMGMESGQIQNDAIIASSQKNSTDGPEKARLHFKGGWIPQTSDQNQWLQVDFRHAAQIKGISTQGHQFEFFWVKSYSLRYSADGADYEEYQSASHKKIFQGNSDQNSTVFNTFEPHIVARFIRIHPITFHGWISLRMEFYGCRSGFPTLKSPVCETGLGLESFVIPDSSVTASSTLSLHKPGNGRLHLYIKAKGVGGWVSGNTRNDSWFQVDFGNWTKVTRISTQGRQDVPQWVTKYRVSYSYDGIFFTHYSKILDGNSDQFTVVSHKLQDPIITRYIRINPLSYYGWIALRADFYGCQSGFPVPDMSCWKPMGMESGQIQNNSIIASSQKHSTDGPEKARLHFEGGWIPQISDQSQWLQVDFRRATQITGISTQGHHFRSFWVKSYSLRYSSNGTGFKEYQPASNGNKILAGNADRINLVSHQLNLPITARYLRIIPKSWNLEIALRVEFYGCIKWTISGCNSPLGMENNAIPDSAIKATTDRQFHEVFNARLGKTWAWSSLFHDKGQWIQVDLGKITMVTMIATQGHKLMPLWVNEYKVSYGFDGGYYKFYQQGPNNSFHQIFLGNNNQDSAVINTFNPPIVARFIRIHPVKFHWGIALRMELYGCHSGFPTPKPPVCEASLGLENYALPNSLVTASSALDPFKPGNGRLHLYIKPGTYNTITGGWVPFDPRDDGSWFQVDFRNWARVTGISTQGSSQQFFWVTKYRVSYSYDGIFFKNYPKVFDGNSDQFTVVTYKLESPIITRCIRINPKSFHNGVALRADFYGCKSGFAVPKISCKTPLGMESGLLPNDSITVSSQSTIIPFDAYVNARLHVRQGAWRPQITDNNQWLEVNLGHKTQVTGISTQGHPLLGWRYWVKSYSLRYSNDGSYFNIYQTGQLTKIFSGNTDQNNLVSHELIPPIRTRYLRIYPKSWNFAIALRVELYGCRKENGGYSDWSEWSQCSATCGLGSRSRNRSCTNPPPGPYGDDCSHLGKNTEKGECKNSKCPEKSTYSQWSPWSQCSVTCGVGSRSRTRSCANSSPRSNADDCSRLGNSNQTMECNITSCIGNFQTTADASSSSNATTYVSISVGVLAAIALSAGLLKGYLFFRKKKFPGGDISEFTYHAFIIYSQEDSHWVNRNLLPFLEEKHHLKCCVHYRDFAPGRPFQESMAESVYNSYKIIAVLSSNLLKSNYCSYELNIAKYRLLSKGDNSLIFIRIDNEDCRKLPRELRKRSFIDYSNLLERPLWEHKLLKFLNAEHDPGNRSEESEQNCVYDHGRNGPVIGNANEPRNEDDRFDLLKETVL